MFKTPAILSVIFCAIINFAMGDSRTIDVLKTYSGKNPIEARWGLEVNQAWDQLMSLLLAQSPPTKKDLNLAYEILWSAKIGKGRETASYVIDLYKVFKQKPEVLIEQAQRFFKNNNYCLLYWLIPKTQFIEYKEFQNDLKSALQKNSESKMLKEFESQADNYYKRLIGEQSISELSQCKLFVFKDKE